MAALEQEERTRELNAKNAEIKNLKKEIYDLSAKYRQKVRCLLNCSEFLLDKDDKIEQLTRMIDSLQLENANLKSSVKDREIQIVELEKRFQDVQSVAEFRPEDQTRLHSENENLKQHIDHLNKQIETLQSEVQTRTNENTVLRLENNNLKYCLEQKDSQLVESESKCKALEEYIDENAVDLPPGGMVHEGKIVITGQVDEEMPQVESTENVQTETEVIFLSSDEDEPCKSTKLEEKNKLPEPSRKPIQEPESKESDQELMSKRRPVLSKFLQGIEEDDEQEPETDPETEIEAELEAEPEADPATEPEQEVQTPIQNENTALLKRHYKFYSDEENNEIIYYIFNVYKPVTPNPPFGVPYFRILSQKLEEDRVCERTSGSLYDAFKRIRIYELYKNKQLHTAEHRKIAIRAFRTFDSKRNQILIDQYDRARAPGITDEQIAEMNSLNKPLHEIEVGKKQKSHVEKGSRNHFSVKEEAKIIDLMFNVIQVNDPNERHRKEFWKKIRAEMVKILANHKRSLLDYKAHFRRHLLPTLHERDDLHTPEHRRIAVEVYSLWYKPDLIEQHIHQYDTARQSRNNTSFTRITP